MSLVEESLEDEISAMEAEEDISPERRKEIDEIFDMELLPHIKALYNFAYRLSNDEDDADDLVQDTYLKAFRFIKSYERGSNAKAWLYRILKNSFINRYRKSSREPGKVDYQTAELYLNTGKSSHTDSIDARERMYQSNIGDEVAIALQKLPVDFRTVIVLCDLEDFTYEEISKIIDIPIGTVRSRLHRARQMLREMLLEYAISMGYNKE